jgi:hypothetical protein
MRDKPQPGERKGLKSAGSDSTSSDLDRKYWAALILYTALGLLAWFTLGEGKVLVGNRLVDVRWFPLVVLGGFALKTVLARHAEKIRRDGKESS